ncbi:MAG: alcohol dehydrogenase [Alphaproteobacteria bacterium]|nr:MAG: alcohol dehydrogenase [Alphaproteobacteria bacterium]
MKAVIARNKSLVVDDWPDPEPKQGEVLVKTLVCGICGSDLHALNHGEHFVDLTRRGGGALTYEPDKDLVFGHEFCAEILDHGPGTQKLFRTGTRVCSLPIAVTESGVQGIGYSNTYAGGYGEQMVLSETMLVEVPNGLASDHAALTEPMAVGAHAVNEAEMGPNDVALVIGCGPVGLAVIAGLKARGLGPVIAADFSPGRRGLAETMGADVVVDPKETSPYSQWADFGVPQTSMERMMVEMMGETPRRAIIFECVGVKGVVQQILEGVPVRSRIVIVGVCMETDHFEPALAVTKQLDLRFVLGYSQEEFAGTLHMIAEGEIDVAPLVTGRVGLEGVAQAFEDLAHPEKHAKILVDPTLV